MAFLVGLPVLLFFFASRIKGFMAPFVPHFTRIGGRIVGSALVISGVDSYPNCGWIWVKKEQKIGLFMFISLILLLQMIVFGVGPTWHSSAKKMFKSITFCENCFGTKNSYSNIVGVSWGSPTPLLVIQFLIHRSETYWPTTNTMPWALNWHAYHAYVSCVWWMKMMGGHHFSGPTQDLCR